jgi:uncharacterized integral membrane protein (TIGR00698 family)
MEGILFMKDLYKGLLIVVTISLLSILLNLFVIGFVETLTISIIIGILFSNIIGIHHSLNDGINFALKKVLKWGIVLLGVKLDFTLLVSLGPKILAIILTIVLVALIISYIFGKYGKLNSKLSTLLGVGSSVCGASAIVAMGPVIDAEEEDVAISVAVISLLGALGVILYSFFAKILPITDIQYGIWAGSSLQGVAHALAAAGARGTDSLSIEIGTIVKMSRVALLGPIAIILSILFKKDTKKNRIKFPMYVLYFLIIGIIFTLNNKFSFIVTEFDLFSIKFNIVGILKGLSNFFILMAMTAMGLKVNLKSFEKKGLRALGVCSAVFIILSLLSIGMVSLL